MMPEPVTVEYKASAKGPIGDLLRLFMPDPDLTYTFIRELPTGGGVKVRIGPEWRPAKPGSEDALIVQITTIDPEAPGKVVVEADDVYDVVMLMESEERRLSGAAQRLIEALRINTNLRPNNGGEAPGLHGCRTCGGIGGTCLSPEACKRIKNVEEQF